MAKLTIKGFWGLVKGAGSGFVADKVTKLSAALAYYTIFSLGPMLIVIIYLSNLFFRQQAVEGRIFGQIRQLVGDKAALQIQEIIANVAVSGSNTLAAIIGFVTLLIGATTVFAEIQDSINSIWKLRVKPEQGIMKMLKNRLLSFSLVVSLGFLLLVSLIINSLIEGLMDKLKELFPQITVVLIYIVNLLITLIIISTLFAIIFKVLPDALIKWRDVAVGAIFTAVLFMIGKFAITLYIKNSNPGSAYGAAGSLVILLVWIYYTSIILYYGAEFTRCYAMKFGAEIRPDQYAVIIQTVQVESKSKSLQQDEKSAKKVEEEVQKTKEKIDAEEEKKAPPNIANNADKA